MKKWFASKTMICNILITAAGVLAVLSGSDWIMENPQVSAVILAAVGGVNMVLRLVTCKAIG